MEFFPGAKGSFFKYQERRRGMIELLFAGILLGGIYGFYKKNADLAFKLLMGASLLATWVMMLFAIGIVALNINGPAEEFFAWIFSLALIAIMIAATVIFGVKVRESKAFTTIPASPS